MDSVGEFIFFVSLEKEKYNIYLIVRDNRNMGNNGEVFLLIIELGLLYLEWELRVEIKIVIFEDFC